jgi:hypothetical protein
MIPSPDITLRTSDTLPFVQQYLRNRDGSIFSIPDGTSVEFVYRSYAMPSTPVEVSGQVVNGPAGLVRAQLNPIVPLLAGRYQAWWRLTLATDDVISFPNSGYEWMQVTPE